MNDQIAIAIVGVGAILPDAPDVQTFWKNIQIGRYSISEVPAERWKADLYFDSNPSAPDKTYSKIGGWVRGFKLETRQMGIAIPPRVLTQIDEGQQWAIAASSQALKDYGYPERYLNQERIAVILGSALGGEHHYLTTIRIHLPEYLEILSSVDAFKNLPGDVQHSLLEGLSSGLKSRTPNITEDTMPGELSNIIAGRVANVFNFSGPNFVTDAACASSLAALQSAVEGLAANRFDAVLTGGVDRNMGPEAFVKFSKIGALSPDGSRPYAEGANGFVMGEGAAIFLLKRLVDAERDDDKIYAVVRGVGGSSDGKGKGITAPNPIGQQRAIERAWKNAGISPASAGLIEGHGTSTPIGDMAEVNSLSSIFGSLGIKESSIALGSVKSNFGHLKSAAGAAGLLKAVMALNDHLLPPSVNCQQTNTKIDFAHLPFYVNKETKPWEVSQGQIRRAGVSAFGFGGTNFHVVLDEYLPGVLTKERTIYPGVELKSAVQIIANESSESTKTNMKPYRGLFFVSGDSITDLRQSLVEKLSQVKRDGLAAVTCPTPEDLGKHERLVINSENPDELSKYAEMAISVMDDETPSTWQTLSMRGIFRGSGEAGKVAFLFPGQGSQYVNMLRKLKDIEPIVADTFREADEVMTPILGKPISSYIFVDGNEATLARAEKELRNTTITQPALLSANVAILRTMAKFGFHPDLVLGHSLGEYAALVAAGVLTLPEALEVVSARGKEMAKVAADDNGCMAAVSAPLEEVERILKSIEGYVVIANINSPVQCVIGGRTAAVEAAIVAFLSSGFQATKIPVSHAFHTEIVAPASQPLRRVIASMNVQTPKISVVANVTGKIYPNGKEEILDILAAQVASPVQFVQGVNTLYEEGARIFVEIGPKRVLSGLASDILKGKQDVSIFSTNHPRKGDLESFQEALCRLYAAGVTEREKPSKLVQLADVGKTSPVLAPVSDGYTPLTGSVVISGAGLGLPGRDKNVFDDQNILSILNGDMRLEPLPPETRQSMLDKRPTRLVKSEAGAVMQTIDDLDLTIKLAGQRGKFDIVDEFGFPQERLEAIDISTQLAIAAGIEALRDAGIPLVMAYKKTSTGSHLPDRWKLPEALADETGVIFGSAFPGLDQMANEADKYYQNKMVLTQLEELRKLADLATDSLPELQDALSTRIQELEAKAAELDYHFDRRFIFRVLSMGHSQFAEYIGARGPNTHVNAACATTTHAIAIAEDWIRRGRARRVIVVSGDDVISGSLSQWIGTSLLASGAATTEGELRLAALPFDKRRNGMLIGMAATALVIESEDAVRERGMRGICELLASNISNSAFHGTRLDVHHVSQVMETLLRTAEKRFDISRSQIAPDTMFVSHETYTPARGGSAAAEIHALRNTFGENANQVIIANTKGFTGHTMGVGVEDVVAVKALEYGIVPPIANIQDGFEPDPELGDLNLSRGGQYPIQFSLRLGAGFGSQIAMTLLRKIHGQAERVDKHVYQRWLSDVSGYSSAETEIVKRTLHIRDQGIPVRQPAQSQWQYGQGPTQWTAISSIEKEPRPENPQPAQPHEQKSIVGDEEIKSFLLNTVSEKTGYPVDMLELDLDLEADLGIDTVKQAELFAAIREHYGIARREDLRLADYNTLAKVINFVKDSNGSSITDLNASRSPMLSDHKVQANIPLTVDSVRKEDIQAYLVNAISEKTGYPVEMLELDLDLEADLGIDTVKQAELFAAIREHYSIPRREDLRLSDYNTLAKVVRFVEDALVAAPVTDEVDEGAHEVSDSTTDMSVSIPDLTLGTGIEAIKAYLLAAVSEKTGYPVEMLEPDLDLEADLGIDTVKQAELFASIREHYKIPRDENLRLSDYNTLAKVVDFVDHALHSKIETPPEKTSNPPMIVPTREHEGSALPGEIVRRIPVPALRPRLDLCQPTGVVLNEQSRILVIEGASKVGESLIRKLKNRDVDVLPMGAGIGLAQISENIKIWLSAGPIQGVFFLPGLDVEPSLSEMSAEVWQDSLNQRLYNLSCVMRPMPDETFLVCATRMGGLHGYSVEGATAPMGGAITGFAKALARERSNAFVKVVDFEADAPVSEISTHLIDETLWGPGEVEVGWENNLRFGVATIEEPLPTTNNFHLENGSIFVISGGSAGIIRPIVEDLVQATHGVFYLLTRSAFPDSDNPDINRLTSDREGLKKELSTRLSTDNRKATPVQVDQALAVIERSAAAQETRDIINQMGGKAHFIVCDVTDPAMVENAIQSVKEAEGHIDVFIHAAGIDHSRKLRKKTIEDFHAVVSVKVDGFFNLFKAMQIKNVLPRAVVFFSSVAGRFGNSGQTDYSAANDLLCKFASAMRNQYPDIKAVAIDWSAWGEVGMATRGNIPTLMNMAGIDLLTSKQAAPLVRGELLAAGGESIAARSLGILGEHQILNGGMDIEHANKALRAGKPIHTMLSYITDFDFDRGLVLEVELDPATQPFLHDHSIDGTPVLPGVMGIEGFTIAAKHIGSVLASMKGSEFEVSKLQNIRFLAAFKFYGNKARRATWVVRAIREKGGVVAYVSLESTRTRKNRVDDHMLHFTGKVYLEPQGSLKTAKTVEPPNWNGNYTVKAEDIYRLYFHGPAFQVLEGVQRSGDTILGKLHKGLPAMTSDNQSLLSAPTLVELCFQTAGIWEMGKTGTRALPHSIQSLTLYQRNVNGIPIYAEVTPKQVQKGEMHFDARVVDAEGQLYLELKEYRTVTISGNVKKELLTPLEELVNKS